MKLDHSNYMIWKKKILKILKSYELEDFVMRRKKYPQRNLDNGVVNPDYKFWSFQDQMIGYLLIIFMNDEIIKKVYDYDTSTM